MRMELLRSTTALRRARGVGTTHLQAHWTASATAVDDGPQDAGQTSTAQGSSPKTAVQEGTCENTPWSSLLVRQELLVSWRCAQGWLSPFWNSGRRSAPPSDCRGTRPHDL